MRLFVFVRYARTCVRLKAGVGYRLSRLHGVDGAVVSGQKTVNLRVGQGAQEHTPRTDIWTAFSCNYAHDVLDASLNKILRLSLGLEG